MFTYCNGGDEDVGDDIVDNGCAIVAICTTILRSKVKIECNE